MVTDALCHCKNPGGFNMTEAPVDKQSPAYRLGYSDGQANAKKWQAIAQMWGGLGLFLFLVLVFVAVPMYRDHNEQAGRHDRITACANAADIPACIKAVDK